MGMYTELIFSAELDGNLPDEVKNILQFMCTGENKPDKIPTHALFDTDRWEYLFRMSSYYFVDTIDPVFRYDKVGKDWRLTTRSNLKNYCNEIEKFIDWIKPFIRGGCGSREYYAIVCYEKQEKPTIYYLDESRATEGEPPEFHWQCEKCKEVFEPDESGKCPHCGYEC